MVLSNACRSTAHPGADGRRPDRPLRELHIRGAGGGRRHSSEPHGPWIEHRRLRDLRHQVAPPTPRTAPPRLLLFVCGPARRPSPRITGVHQRPRNRCRARRCRALAPHSNPISRPCGIATTSLPLNGRWRLAGDIQEHTIDLRNLVHYPGRYCGEDVIRQPKPVSSHRILAGNRP